MVMKHCPGIVLLVICFAFPYCRSSRPIVKTPFDLQVICTQDHKFIGKPLKYLVGAIKPKIEFVMAQGGGSEQSARMSFFFIPRERYERLRSRNVIRITMFFRKKFEWPFEERMKRAAGPFVWDENDLKRYGNMIVGAIRIYGEYRPEDY